MVNFAINFGLMSRVRVQHYEGFRRLNKIKQKCVSTVKKNVSKPSNQVAFEKTGKVTTHQIN